MKHILRLQITRVSIYKRSVRFLYYGSNMQGGGGGERGALSIAHLQVVQFVSDASLLGDVTGLYSCDVSNVLA